MRLAGIDEFSDYASDQSLEELVQQFGNQQPSSKNVWRGAAGRILNDQVDQAVVAHFSGNELIQIQKVLPNARRSQENNVDACQKSKEGKRIALNRQIPEIRATAMVI